MDWLVDDDYMIETFQRPPWKIAVIDDEPEVHKVTELTLKGFEFEDRKLTLLSAYSAQQAMALFQQHDDIAVAFVDVVMEQDNAGLELVKYIREELNNHYTRIVLRTGQPGTKPEQEVIRSFDIDGYKAKTEFTTDNFYLTLYTTLRSYRDIISIQRYQKGLQAVVNSMAKLAEVDKISDFAAALMQQLAVVLNSSETEFIMQDSEAFALTSNKGERWHIMVNEESTELLTQGQRTKDNQDFVNIGERALAQKQSLLEPPLYAHYFCSKKQLESVFILRNSQLLSDFNQHLLQLFSQNTLLMLEHLFDKNQ